MTFDSDGYILAQENRSWLKWNREREPRLQPEQGPVETRRSGIVVHTKTGKSQFP